MNRANQQQAYLKKSARPRRPNRHSRQRSKSRAHTRTRQFPKQVQTNAMPESLLKSLSSINLVSILNSFYTVRTTVKDLRVSLEKLDSAMDSVYQMFEIAQGFSKRAPAQSRRAPLRLLPPPTDKRSAEQRKTEPTADNNENPLAGLLENVDIGQIVSLVQSPFVQGLLKQFAEGQNEVTTSEQREKEG